MALRLLRSINSIAPIRIADNGGWTDTWFTKHGRVFNIAVSPFAEVLLEVFPADTQSYHILIQAENYGDTYEPKYRRGKWDKHPLLEATIRYMNVPEELAIRISIHSE